MDSQKTDPITKRPRTPNMPYTIMTEEQLRNLKKDSSPHFSITNRVEFDGSNGHKRRYVDRYVNSTNEHLLRGISRTNPHCWIDRQWQQDPPEDHNNSRLGASIRWGPVTAGNRTYQHYGSQEARQYTNIDMYKRHPTNTSGPVFMDFGRPGQGYYSQKNPAMTTWFGSTAPLNQTHILENIHPKTVADYEFLKAQSNGRLLARRGQWPEYSEYHDRFALRTRIAARITTLEQRKRNMAESKLLAEAQ